MTLSSSPPIYLAALLLMLTACTDTSPVAEEDLSRATSTTPSASQPGTTTTHPTTMPTTSDPAPTVTTATLPVNTPIPVDELEVVDFPVPPGSRPHDVAPAADGGVWYTAQGSGELGWLDPTSGETRHIGLGPGSRPHGVIVDSDGAAWITDGGRNSIIRFDPDNDEVSEYPLPDERADANLNTAAFDGTGRLWFTGQNGIIGVLDPSNGEIEVFDSPRGRGPYGIAATPLGTIYFASLAGSYVGLVGEDASITVLEPPTPDQGARRVWSDSQGAIWVSEWNSGQLSRYNATAETWDTWPLPGAAPQAYAVYVDDTDIVWVSDFGGNTIHRFDSDSETFHTFELPNSPSNVRQILGRPGEVWGAESAADTLVVIRRISG